MASNCSAIQFVHLEQDGIDALDCNSFGGLLGFRIIDIMSGDVLDVFYISLVYNI
jgi:hypothetical protein